MTVSKLEKLFLKLLYNCIGTIYTLVFKKLNELSLMYKIFLIKPFAPVLCSLYVLALQKLSECSLESVNFTFLKNKALENDTIATRASKLKGQNCKRNFLFLISLDNLSNLHYKILFFSFSQFIIIGSLKLSMYSYGFQGYNELVVLYFNCVFLMFVISNAIIATIRDVSSIQSNSRSVYYNLIGLMTLGIEPLMYRRHLKKVLEEELHSQEYLV